MKNFIKSVIAYFTFDKLFKIALLIVLLRISNTFSDIYLSSPSDLSADLGAINESLENINRTLDDLKDEIANRE